MEFSSKQDAALKAVSNWLNDPKRAQVFRLFGYAGTGKTTLAQHFASGVDGQVVFGAYTGKAAHVLRQKGCPGASTIHSMIYRTHDKAKARLRELEDQYLELIQELRAENPELDLSTYKPKRVKDILELIENEKRSLARPSFSLNHDSDIQHAKLIVIDECSMVDEQMGQDLLSFKVPILVLGDPAQLPPVKGGGYFTEVKPDFMLTEIHRQAKDNPILELATKVRQGEKLALGQYGSSSVVDKITANDALSADQILVGKNVTRQSSNARFRSLKGLTGQYPVTGDKLVCLRNNHEKSLLNGAIWFVEELTSIDNDQEKLYMKIRPEDGGEVIETDAHTHHFLGQGDKLAWWERKESEEFDYGYALTVHKSQGSQWPKVLLIDESHVFKEDRNRWLYTGITRAAESVKIMRS